MQNNFYSEFDIEKIHPSKRDNDHRSPFQIDRDKLIHSSEFRRLQGKTQVFLPGEFDFYRTRLTHSIEVAQIGRSICNYLNKVDKDHFSDDFHIDSDLVEATCLAHDLGHPPFGHAGEKTLNRLLGNYDGFEGNAQTLRLLTETFYRDENGRRGMNPTRALIDGILKYKSLHSDFENPHNHFLYNYQQEFLDFVFDNEQPRDYFKPVDELNDFRSIECMIMDWADDTAYAINDLVDSIAAGFITIEKLHKWQRHNEDKFTLPEHNYLDEIINWIKSGKYKAKFGSHIGDFIYASSIKERENFMSKKTNRYKYELVVVPEILQKAKFYKRISIELIFRSSQVHQIEFKGDYMISQVFKVFEDNYITASGKQLLPDFTSKIIEREKDNNKRARLVCDYIAGMTDTFAMRTYRRLFDPDYSSVIDLVSLRE